MEAHRLDDPVGVAFLEEFSDSPVRIDDAVHQRREQRMVATRGRNPRLGQPVEHVVALDHQQVEIIDEPLVPARLDHRLVKLPVEFQPAR